MAETNLWTFEDSQEQETSVHLCYGRDIYRKGKTRDKRRSMTVKKGVRGSATAVPGKVEGSVRGRKNEVTVITELEATNTSSSTTHCACEA